MQKDHSCYMKMASDLALKAKGRTSPNPLVGAVIVRNNRILATGFHHRCGADHAEVDALKKIRGKAKGATLYVTLEPCGHYGRTPPCTDAIIQSGIKHVVIGTKDPNPVTSGRSIRRLNKAGIKTTLGVLSKDLRKMNENFFKFIRQKMPFVVIKCAQSIDGKIATASGMSKWITSFKTRHFSHCLRDEFDAILVGINTVLKDDPYLNGVRKGKRLKKIILDPHLKVSLKANLFKGTDPKDIFIIAMPTANCRKSSQLQKKGVNVISCPARAGSLDLKRLFKKMACCSITSILVEGGSRTIGRILKAGLADKAWIFIAPKIIGAQEALSACVGLETTDVNKALRLKDIDVRRIGEDIFVEGYIA